MDVVVSAPPRRVRRLLGAVGVLAITGLAVGIVRSGDAAPRVARSTLWIERVQRGTLVRDVSAPGSLVSDEVRLVTAKVGGIVDRVHVKPGADVGPDTLLLELSNPDLEFAALEAATAVKEARAAALDLRATLQIQQLEQRAEVQNLRTQHRETERRAQANAKLADEQLVAGLEIEQVRERSAELGERLALQEAHSLALEDATEARLAAQRARVEGLGAQVALRRMLVLGLQVHASAPGLLTELAVEPGQQVTAGAVLGKIIDPHKLKAVLRVPEARARDVLVGQPVLLTVQTEAARGHVTRIDPAVQQGSVRVEASFDGVPPAGARLDLSVEGRIEIESMPDAIFVAKPSALPADGAVSMFKVAQDGRSAQRVRVRLGRTSASAVEVLQGLQPGEKVILSDMSDWSGVDRVEIE